MTDEYVTLVEATQDALRDLLRETEPGTGMSLHVAYGDLKTLLEKHRAPAATTPAVTVDPEREERDRLRRAWVQRSVADQERQILETIADGRLTASEVAERLAGHYAYRETMTYMLRRLIEKGEVCRAEIPGYTGGPVPKWHYFRNAELRGPIADLERAFDDETETTS